METVIFGLGTAFGWGFADFFARFTSRGFGTALALAVMLVTSSIMLTLIAPIPFALPAWDLEGAAFLLLGGIGILAGTACLYWGLARGPVSLVSAIVASYPAFNLALAVVLGIHLTIGQWGLIALVMAGVITVSRASGGMTTHEVYAPEERAKTILIALAASGGFAFGLAGLQLATPFYGEWGTLVYSRWISALVACAALIVLRPKRMSGGTRALGGLLLIQGMLDGLAYLSLLYGSEGAGAAIVVVVASCFSIVTLLLARIIMKERMVIAQKIGVAMVIGGVASLAWLGAGGH